MTESQEQEALPLGTDGTPDPIPAPEDGGEAAAADETPAAPRPLSSDEGELGPRPLSPDQTDEAEAEAAPEDAGESDEAVDAAVAENAADAPHT